MNLYLNLPFIGLHLGAHKNIVTTYDVAFETAGFYVFTQEYAPLGDLTSNVSDTGIGEMHTKRVAKQIASALDYIHAKFVHSNNFFKNRRFTFKLYKCAKTKIQFVSIFLGNSFTET